MYWAYVMISELGGTMYWVYVSWGGTMYWVYVSWGGHNVLGVCELGGAQCTGCM